MDSVHYTERYWKIMDNVLYTESYWQIIDNRESIKAVLGS